MKSIIKMLAFAAVTLPLFASCSGGSSSDSLLFGALPGVYEGYQAEKNELEEKAKDIKSEEDKAKLIAESKELTDEWTGKIESAAQELDGRKVEITDADIKVSEPLTLTYDGLFSKSDITPEFVINGAAQAATDFTPESPVPSASYSVYIVGYNAEGTEVFATKCGFIPATLEESKAVIKAGTPVQFEKIHFSDNYVNEYQQATTLKLVAR